MPTSITSIFLPSKMEKRWKRYEHSDVQKLNFYLFLLYISMMRAAYCMKELIGAGNA